MAQCIWRHLRVLLMVVALGGASVVLVSLAMAGPDIRAAANTLKGTGTLGRDLEPVIVTGAQVEVFSGSSVNQLFVYRYSGGAWRQIPFQVDEVTAAGAYTTTEDGLLDANDEIVFMAMDLGGQAPASDPIIASVPILAPWYEIEVTDPTNSAQKGWAYLVRSSTLARTFTTDYVGFDSGLHRINGTSYSLGFGTTHPVFEYLALGGSGVDILDRNKIRMHGAIVIPPLPPLTEEFLGPFPDDVIKDGPVRVIVRGGKGLAYGSMVWWEIYIPTLLPGYRKAVRFSTDFAETASGSMHYNAAVPAGVTVDGIADAVPTTPLSLWWQLSAGYGTLIQVCDTSSIGGKQTNYYLDDSALDKKDTGDQRSYGDTGVYIEDPNLTFTYTFALYFLPGTQPNVGASYAAYFAQPLSVRALIPPPNVSLGKRVIGTDFEPGDRITFTLSIINGGAKIASGVVVTDILPAEVLTPTFASTLAITPIGPLSYVWNVGSLGIGKGGVITISGLISPGLPSDFIMVNRATIWDPEDNTPANNTGVVIVNGYVVYLPLVMKN